MRTTGVDCPVLLVTTEGALAALTAEWGVDDVILEDAGPAEVEARLRLAIGRLAARTGTEDELGEIRRGDVTVDEATYTARVKGRVLDLTFKEFELLKFLAQHPGRVFSRAQLLQEVWGYDYYGGTRTVDVHVRRLRAKLGSDHETLIGTVRNVGYRFVLPKEPEGHRRRPTPDPGAGRLTGRPDVRPSDARLRRPWTTRRGGAPLGAPPLRRRVSRPWPAALTAAGCCGTPEAP